jgi:hypothetical protein
MNPLGGLPQESHSSSPPPYLGGYISFHKSIKKAAIATSCEPQVEISSSAGEESIVINVEDEEEEEEDGKLDSRIFYQLAQDL